MTLPLNPCHAAVAQARSLLFVPGDRPERYAKAQASGADAVVIDLEDAVAPAAKAAARQGIESAWPTLCASPVPTLVRINASPAQGDAPWLATLAPLTPPAGVLLPKTESAQQLTELARLLPGVPLIPMIESAAGLHALEAIASAPQVLRLAIGHIDFMADTGLLCSDDERELDPLRFAIAMATRRHKLAAALDGVTVAFQDDARLRADTTRALRFAFGGKLCIHPRQVAVVHEALCPSDDEVAWAEQIIVADRASGGAAVQLDGRMVDLPMVLQAHRTLARRRR